MRGEFSKEAIINGLASGNLKEENHILRYLYEAYYDLIEIFVMKNNGSADDARDVFQDALIVLYNKAQTADFTLTCSVKTFLYSICRNLWLDKLRQKANRSRLLEAHDFIDIQEDDLKVLLENERSGLIITLLEQLGEKCKSVLTLFYYHNKNMKEIAYTLNMASEAVARNKKHACMKKFREKIIDNEMLKQLLYF